MLYHIKDTYFKSYLDKKQCKRLQRYAFTPDKNDFNLEYSWQNRT
jgi:hypothetical protein